MEAATLQEAIGFEELAESARPALVRAAYAVTGRREDAEDAVQSSLVKAMGAWQRVAGQERWRQQAYVRQIVVNTCRSGWRKVLLLRYYEDLSEAEIATRLGCAPGTVKSSAARALRALRDMLPEYAGQGVGSAGVQSSGAFHPPLTAPEAPATGPIALKSA